MGSGPNQSNYSRTWILREVEDSLRRLATDYVDILYLHRDFTGANLEEPVRAMGDLIRAGKIRYCGRVEFPWLAHRRDRAACATAWACRARWPASRTTTC